MQTHILQLSNIGERVQQLDIQPLGPENFKAFATGVERLFVIGSQFQEFYSPGLNSLSAGIFDFSQGKPAWRVDQPPYNQPATIERVSRRGTEGHEWIYIKRKPNNTS